MQQSVLDVMGEGIIVIDPDRRLLQANAAAVAMLALDLDAARADPDWWRGYRWRTAADGLPMDTERITLDGGKSYRDVHVLGRLPDGSDVRWSANFEPLRDADGAVNGLVVSFQDVTDQMRAHRDLVTSQERLRAAYAVARLSSWEMDPETNELEVYEALAAHSSLAGNQGRARGDAGRRRAGQPRRGPRGLCRRCWPGTGTRPSGAARWSTPRAAENSGWRPASARSTTRDGRVMRLRGTTQDVTEEELAKQEAVAARDFFQTTLDSLSAHIAVLDDQGRIIMTNRAWVEFAAAGGAEPADLGDELPGGVRRRAR